LGQVNRDPEKKQMDLIAFLDNLLKGKIYGSNTLFYELRKANAG
jgi:hypothetical protein